MNEKNVRSCIERIEEVLKHYGCTLDSANENKYCYDLLCFHGVRLCSQLVTAKQELSDEVSECFCCFSAVVDVERTVVISELRKLLEYARKYVE